MLSLYVEPTKYDITFISALLGCQAWPLQTINRIYKTLHNIKFSDHRALLMRSAKLVAVQEKSSSIKLLIVYSM